MKPLGQIRPRWFAWIIAILALLGGELRYRDLFEHYPLIGAAVVIAVLVGLAVWVLGQRHQFRVEGVENVDAPSIQAGLRLAALPAEWKHLVIPVLRAKDGDLEGVAVNVRCDGDWLVIRRVWNPSRHFEPFEARYPLAAVTDVIVGRPVVALIGSTIVFQLASGGEVRFDVQAGKELAELAAERFRDAANVARVAGPPPLAFLKITTSS